MNDKTRVLFDDRQKEIVYDISGPMAVLSSAGSGKSLSLLGRMGFVKKEHPDADIAFLSFSAKTISHVKRMRNDILFPDGLGDYIRESDMYTFHSYALKKLKGLGDEIGQYGLRRDFSVSDQHTVFYILNEIVKKVDTEIKSKILYNLIWELDLNGVDYNNSVAFLEAQVRNLVETNPSKWSKIKPYLDSEFTDILRIFVSYKKILRRNNLLDYNDLINLCNLSVKKEIISLPDYLIVDEFQDVNQAQKDMAVMLSKKSENICIAGDQKQMIYQWRGSSKKFIEEFDSNFKKKVKKVVLDKNYRSDSEIADFSKNIHDGKLLNGKIKKPGAIHYKKVSNPAEEAMLLIAYIDKIVKKGVEYKDIAILFKYYKNALTIEKELIKKGIPYKSGNEDSILDKKIIKEYLSFISFLSNEKNIVGLERWLVGSMKYLHYKELNRIKESGSDVYEFLYSDIKKEYSWLPVKKIKKLVKLREGIGEIRRVIDLSPSNEIFILNFNKLFGFIAEIEKRSYSAKEKKSREYYKESLMALHAVNSIFLEYRDVESFINNVSIEKDGSVMDSKITLTSIHGSKGLEFKCVFMTHMNDGILPLYAAHRNPSIMEEERNLFYVGVTRSKNFLLLTSVKFTEMGEQQPSEFIKMVVGG